MTTKFKTCVETKAGTLVLPAGRLSYPNLFVPRRGADDDSGEPKYSTSIILPGDVDLSLAIKWVEDAAVEKWGKDALKKLKKPFLKHAEKSEDEALTSAFPYLIRCSSKMAPQVMLASGSFVSKEDGDEEVYPGRWARVSVRAYAWEYKANGRGVSFGLSNVQLLDHDERIGGGKAKAEDEFEAVEIADGKAAGGADPDRMFS